MKRSLHNEDEIQLRLVLRQRRQEMGMPQWALARLMGKSRTFISKYEQGNTFLLFSEVVLLCHLLSLDIQYLADLIERSMEEEQEIWEAAEENAW